MGQIVSLVTSALGLTGSIKKEVDREKKRKLNQETKKLTNPIKPPEFWPTLESRRSHVPDGPYSVEGIRESLSTGVLPAGWSEEQLENVGFAADVKKYQNGVERDRKTLLISLSSSLGALADGISSVLEDESELSSTLIRAGVGDAKVVWLRGLSKRAKEGELSPDEAATSLSENQTLLNKAQGLQDADRTAVALDKSIGDAFASREAGILGILRLALGASTVKRVKPVA